MLYALTVLSLRACYVHGVFFMRQYHANGTAVLCAACMPLWRGPYYAHYRFCRCSLHYQRSKLILTASLSCPGILAEITVDSILPLLDANVALLMVLRMGWRRNRRRPRFCLVDHWVSAESRIINRFWIF